MFHVDIWLGKSVKVICQKIVISKWDYGGLKKQVFGVALVTGAILIL